MKEQFLTDKSYWPEGPWKKEPDRVSWLDILRNYGGSLCGYVAIPSSHPFYEKDYSKLQGIETHGGLTYSNHCNGTPDEGICHSTEHEDKVWWLGFDCAHLFDFSPNGTPLGIIEKYPNIMNRYKNIEYIKKEVKSLSEQLKNREDL
jgi:hypothetical protein